MLMQNNRRGALCLCTTAAIGLFTTLATAGGANPVGPFAGETTESWESFDNYNVDPDFNMDEPTICFGGGAAISGGGVMVIYEPGAANFGLATPGSAQVVDGVKGHGLNTGPDATAAISFDPPVCAFGGYFGAAILDGTYDGFVDFAFQDADGNVIGTGSFQYVDDGDGIGDLQWVGWEFDTPVATVNYRGDYVVNDYLQANYCDGGEEKCKGDGNGDGQVNVDDLLGLLAAWGPCQGKAPCEVGFTCGDTLTFCPEGGDNCWCWTAFDGSFVCGMDGSCSGFVICNGGQGDCPDGTNCVIDTCCNDPVCLPECQVGPGSTPDIKIGSIAASSANYGVNTSPTGNYQQIDFGNPDCPYDFNGDGQVNVDDLLSLLANWGPCPMDKVDCEVGFVCGGGDIIVCGQLDDGTQCVCFTHFSGQPLCAGNTNCDLPCPNGDSDCPAGFYCIIDTCCTDNICLPECGDQPEDCEVGFTCGDPELMPCPVDPINCVCVTNWDGTPDCVDISGGSSCSQFVTCNGGPSECPSGTSCIINTCCADAICIPTCGEPQGDCEMGFTCGGDLEICGDNDECVCFTSFNGAPACVQDGFCSQLTPCPGGQGDCPPNHTCCIDTCCNEPICFLNCGSSQSECEVGFTCGGDITSCGSQGQCFCFTGFDGSPVCAFDGSCGNPSCFNGNSDCPTGMVCTIDTCCGDPVCLDTCEGLNPGNGSELKPGTPAASGMITSEGLLRGAGR